ncbi:MAG: SMC-Scp complex subunit ScpB [Gordonibacter sp.]|nr:SMC-Scp complex subunit ScpB [Gordonibacter sp.]
MFQGLQESQISGAVEALLFVTDEPVGTIALADMLEVEPGAVERVLVDLRTRFEADERGIQLREVAGGWRLYTHPVYHELVEKYVLSWDTRKLSQAAMETLAVVAYSQPVTRAGVASVRGVNSDSSINSLVEKGLVREAGTADTPGSPTLYATTRAFLEKFGLRSVSDLPDLGQFAPDDETRAFIRERLSATREPSYISPEVLGVDDTTIVADGFDGLVFDFDEEGSATLPPPQSLSFQAQPTSEATSFPSGSTREVELTRSDQVSEQEIAPDPDKEPSIAAQNLLAGAMAASFGLVEKIDFDSLTFETDDE